SAIGNPLHVAAEPSHGRIAQPQSDRQEEEPHQSRPPRHEMVAAHRMAQKRLWRQGIWGTPHGLTAPAGLGRRDASVDRGQAAAGRRRWPNEAAALTFSWAARR